MTMLTQRDISELRLPGVSEAEQDEVRKLLGVWSSRLERNQKRTVYYDGETPFHDLGIALPPQLKNAHFYLGWPAMAVRKLAQRSQFEGLRLPGSTDPLELSEVFEQNAFGLEFSEAVVSAYKHGVSFVTVAAGQGDEPKVQIQAHAAESAAAIWDRRRRRIKSGLTIGKLDGQMPTEFTLWTDDSVMTFAKSNGSWSVERETHRMGRALMVPITHDPQLGQPFGRSRITNPVMSLTDMAVRAYVRMEGNAEFYSSPQLALEGVDEEAFEGLSQDKKFKLAMDRLLALTRDENENAPSVKQLQQASMTPHSDMLRTVAMAFSGETGIPPSSLGIIHDNPSSAEAIRAAEHDLLIDATHQNEKVLNAGVADIARIAYMVRENETTLPPEAWQLSARFSDPEFRSLSAKADAAVKIAGAFPNLATSDVLLEEVFDDSQVERIRAERRRASARSLMDRLADTGPESPPEDDPATTDEE